MTRLRASLAAALMILCLGVARGSTWYPQGDLPRPLDLGAPMLGEGFSFVPLKQLVEAGGGEVTLLYYFSATCGHCIQAGPDISRLAKELASRGIPSLGIASASNNIAQVNAYKKQFDIDFTIYRDSSGSFGRDNDVRSTPTVFLIKKGGTARSFIGLAAGTDALIAATAVKMAGGDALSLLNPERYNGARVCAACHEAEYRSWSLTHHSVALYSLKDEAQRSDPECIGCHVTGWGKPTGFTELTKTPELVHVGCEQCHGMAGGHGKPRPPKGEAVATWTPTCVACHDKKHSIGFSVAKGLPIVAHGQNRDIPEGQFQAERRKLEAGLVDRPLIAFPEGARVGSEACQSCHATEHAQWAGAKHAGAIASLKAKGEEGNPECLSCHAALRAGGDKKDPAAWIPGVGCESCHGPGEQHVAAGGGPDNIVGLTESCPVCVVEAMCTNCHTQQQDPDFDLDRALPLAGHRGGGEGK